MTEVSGTDSPRHFEVTGSVLRQLQFFGMDELLLGRSGLKNIAGWGVDNPGVFEPWRDVGQCFVVWRHIVSTGDIRMATATGLRADEGGVRSGVEKWRFRSCGGWKGRWSDRGFRGIAGDAADR